MSKKAPTTKTKVECQLWQSNKWLAEALKYIEWLRGEHDKLSVRLCVSCKHENLCAIKTSIKSSRFCRHMDYDGIGCSEWELDGGPAGESEETP